MNVPRLILLAAIICCATIFLNSPATANEATLKKWSLDATYSGIGVGYRFSPRWSTELRAQAVKDVFVAGMRENFHFKPKWGLLPYFGLELDYTKFEGSVTKGKGYAAESFLGAEYYFGRDWSVVLDVGPAWISIKDDDTSEDVNGLEGVINLGINYHFGGEVSR